jgi:A/G-specific adenine glycosylase
MAEGTQKLRPAPKRRPRVRAASYAVLLAVNSDGALLMVRRPRDGLLGGLWEFPAVEMEAGDATPVGGELSVGNSLHQRCLSHLEDLGVQRFGRTVRVEVLPEIRHSFTHLKVVYRPMVVTGRSGGAEAIRSDGPAPSEGERCHDLGHKWVPPDQIEQLPLPVAQRKILHSFFCTAMANAPTTPQENDGNSP